MHHILLMVQELGGIVCFNDFDLYQKAKLLRGWGRSSATFQ